MRIKIESEFLPTPLINREPEGRKNKSPLIIILRSVSTLSISKKQLKILYN